MSLYNLKDYFLKLTKQDFSQKQKIFITASFAWIIFIGYLTWYNKPNTFQWDEWFWFGITPALAPYLFLLIWKPDIFAKYVRCIKDLFNSNT